MNENDLSDLLQRKAEGADLDFKASFDVQHAGEWLEIIKDVVALANSGGGFILIGVADDGTPSGADVTGACSIDPADLTNKIFKYTGINFHDFEIISCLSESANTCVIRVGLARVPIVFTKGGNYEATPGKQKMAFGVGALYFRHGTKSEPATSDDLRSFLDRELEAIRRAWLEGIAKVVEAPTGSRIAVLPPETEPTGHFGEVPLRLVDDPSAPPYYAVPIDTTHPYRQKEVVREVNARLRGRKVVTAHDILSIRRVYNVQKDINFCYTQNFASPRYTQAFVDWIVARFEEDVLFFETAKLKYDQMKRPGGA